MRRLLSLVLAALGAAACAQMNDSAEERACRGGIERLEQAAAAWQGGINAKTQAENQINLADGAADFRRWQRCRAALQRGFRALGQTL